MKVLSAQAFSSHWSDKFFGIKITVTLTFDILTLKSIGSFTVYYHFHTKFEDHRPKLYLIIGWTIF